MIYAKGKRGIVSLENHNGKKIIIKKKNPDSTAIARIEIEAGFLKKLNKNKIGPEFIFYNNDELGMEFIDGILFEEYIQTNSKNKIIKVVKELFNQLYQMDKIGINKEEMHHPFKHIIIRNDLPVLIDFERCNYSEKPKNVTQFTQYLQSEKISLQLSFINKDTLDELKEYKKNINKINFDKLINSVLKDAISENNN